MTVTVKITIRVRTENFGSESKHIVEGDLEDWLAMSSTERDDWCMDAMERFISWDWEVVG